MASNPMKTTKQPTMTMKYTLLALTLGSGLCLSACSAEIDTPSTHKLEQAQNEAAPEEGDIALPIASELSPVLPQLAATAARSLDARVDNSLTGSNDQLRHAISLPKEFPILAIIRSSANDPASYYYLKATQVPQSKHYKVSQERVKLHKDARIAKGKKWYIMFVAGGNIDPKGNYAKLIDAPRINVDASKDEQINAPSSPARSGMDFVMATDWIEIPTWDYGDPKWPKDWSPERRKQTHKLYPLGVLCRASLRLDDDYKELIENTKTTVNVTKLKVVTTGLCFKGYFDVIYRNLPPLVKPAGQRVPKLYWANTQTPNYKREFAYTDRNENEFDKVFTGSVLSVSGTKASPIFESNKPVDKSKKRVLVPEQRSLLFWAMPVPGITPERSRTTLIAETGSVSGASKILSPQHTYIYGKQHKKVAVSGSAVYFDAVYYHPYTPLDYMAEYNMARKNPQSFYVGGEFQPGVSNQWATDHGRNAYAAALFKDVTDKSIHLTGADGRKYGLPKVAQFQSIIPFYEKDKEEVEKYWRNKVEQHKGFKQLNNQQKDMVTKRYKEEAERAIGPGVRHINVQMGTQTRQADHVPLEVQLGAKSSQTKYSARKAANSKVMYALALEDFDGSNKHRVAYRYETIYNPVGISSIKGLTIPFFANQTYTQGQDNKNKDVNWTSDKEKNNLYIRIDAIQLGTQYLGSVDDVANESFWTTAGKRKETRYLPILYNYFYVTTSADGGRFEMLTPSLYAFADHRDIMGVFSRDVRNWSYYTASALIPIVNGQHVKENWNKTSKRLGHVPVTVRPFTTEAHP